MNLIDALAIVSCAVFAALLFTAFVASGTVALLAPFMAVGRGVIDRDRRGAARCVAWWVGSLVALVLLIWIDGNVEPWWP